MKRCTTPLMQKHVKQVQCLHGLSISGCRWFENNTYGYSIVYSLISRAQWAPGENRLTFLWFFTGFTDKPVYFNTR